MAPSGRPPIALAPVPPEAHRRAGPFEKWQFWSPFVIVFLMVAWRLIFYSANVTSPGSAWNNPGSLAAPHASWDNNCSACHPAFTPIGTGGTRGLFGHNHAGDLRCQSCHAGADHHNSEKSEDRAGCTACHREHQGRENSLVMVADAQCTRCHSNLSDHVKEGKTSVEKKVRRFDIAHHPEFGRKRAGNLEFDHGLHLTPGMQKTAGDRMFTLNQVGARHRPLYQDSVKDPDKDPIRLKCSSCHRLDSRDQPTPRDILVGLPNPVEPARSAGALMLPTVYEIDCQGCHPLTMGRAQRDDPLTGSLTLLRHRLQPAEIREFLVVHYTAEALEPPKPGTRPLPGQGLHPKQPEFLDLLKNKIARAEDELYLSKKSCGECHTWKTPPTEVQNLSDLLVKPVDSNEVWFEHASFSHAAHRLLDCLACHEGANTSKDAPLPGMATCVKCHAPSAQGTGGARHDCVECHRYHDGDNPLTSRASTRRAGIHAGTKTIDQFLKADP